MGKADRLSRRSNWEKGGEGDNEERTVMNHPGAPKIKLLFFFFFFSFLFYY